MKKKAELSQFAVDLKSKSNVVYMLENVIQRSKLDLVVSDKETLVSLIRYVILRGKYTINIDELIKDDEYIVRLIEDHAKGE
jgi:predicted  nucleic acid-binding Zn-ribbon protein